MANSTNSPIFVLKGVSFLKSIGTGIVKTTTSNAMFTLAWLSIVAMAFAAIGDAKP